MNAVWSIYRALRLARRGTALAAGRVGPMAGIGHVSRGAGIAFLAGACLVAMSTTVDAARNEAPVQDKPGADTAAIVYETVERLFDRARQAWRDRDHLAVIDTLTAVIGIPSLSEAAKAAALMDRGNAYLQLGELSRAVLDFDASLSLSPAEPERAYLLRGMAYELQGAKDRAAWSYIRALRAAPDNEAINRHVMRFFSAR